MTVGLVLGKFAPFHHGHARVVEQALATCDRVHALVYRAPEATTLPLSTRAAWLRDLYPALRVIEGHDAPTGEGRDPAVQRIQEAYLRRVLPKPVTHFFSSEWYGEPVSRALGAIDVRVDEARVAVPISGREIRRDPFAHRAFVSPRVYFDLLTKVVLVGAESTGKSTLARALAQHFETVDVPEHGRDYWLEHRDAEGLLTPAQLVELAEEHRTLEDRRGHGARGFLFVDTDARVTRQYARFYHGQVAPRLQQLAADCDTRYDLTVVCAHDFAYVEDGYRAGDRRRAEAQAELEAELTACRHPVMRVHGTVEERVEQVCEAMRQHALNGFKR